MVNWLTHYILLSTSFSSQFPLTYLICFFVILNSTISWKHKVNSSLTSVSPFQGDKLTPSTASTQNYLSAALSQSLVSYHLADPVVPYTLHSHDYNLTQQKGLSMCWPSLLINYGQIGLFHVHLYFCSGAASKSISEFKLSWPWTVSPYSLNHDNQISMLTPSTTSPYSLHYRLPCISQSTWSQPWMSKQAQLHSPSLHGYGLQVHLPTHLMAASSISCSSLNLSDQACLQIVLITASISTRTWPSCTSPNLLHHSFQLHVSVYMLIASRCISQFTESGAVSASPNSVNHALQLHLWVYTIKASISVHLHTHLTTGSMYLSKFTHLHSPWAPPTVVQYLLQPDGQYVYWLIDVDNICHIIRRLMFWLYQWWR